ncbi:hypothetical protein TRV_07428 [Trichophyton verrucosum HKI 0517]|uniref:Rhodopsin domain-containing protein n=1 Tax=Trichophyton verrucosum (strain HKI 0517) TaxID=663202 RepID=D4DJR0_TRIVH|nr:uncharacterized protein TRV_07428 [Trichophyton verrucosum HKI 0517]EFE37938.1 hypothetical protein TRV_07428 [Trichophyton verrucosum HKI 0517]
MTQSGPRKGDPTLEIWIGERSLYIFIVFLTVFGSVILIPTAYIRWRHKRLREPEVIFIVLAYIFFLANELVLLGLQTRVYRLSYVALRMKPPYREILNDRHDVIILAYASTYLFYSALWCIKISLLLFFRPFLRALPDQLRWWNVTITYLFITFVFGFLATLLSCGGPRQLNHVAPGQIMILPLRLIYGMHISYAQKIRAGALFSVGMLCMITAIIRLVQIGSKTGITNPNVQWLSLWGTVEATTDRENANGQFLAMVVGCLPTFRLIFKSSPGHDQPNYSIKMPWNNESSSNPPTSSDTQQEAPSSS